MNACVAGKISGLKNPGSLKNASFSHAKRGDQVFAADLLAILLSLGMPTRNSKANANRPTTSEVERMHSTSPGEEMGRRKLDGLRLRMALDKVGSFALGLSGFSSSAEIGGRAEEPIVMAKHSSMINDHRKALLKSDGLARVFNINNDKTSRDIVGMERELELFFPAPRNRLIRTDGREELKEYIKNGSNGNERVDSSPSREAKPRVHAATKMNRFEAAKLEQFTQRIPTVKKVKGGQSKIDRGHGKSRVTRGEETSSHELREWELWRAGLRDKSTHLGSKNSHKVNGILLEKVKESNGNRSAQKKSAAVRNEGFASAPSFERIGEGIRISKKRASQSISKTVLSQVREGVIDEVNAVFASGKEFGEIRLRLFPPELGELKITVKLKDKRVKASFLVENHEVKAIIDAGADKLAEAFTQEGYVLENLSVSVGEQESHTNMEGDYEEGNAFGGASHSSMKRRKVRLSPRRKEGIDILV